MIPAIIHSLPKYFEDLDIVDGWRVCAATVPGLVVINRYRKKANELVITAVNALIEEDSNEFN